MQLTDRFWSEGATFGDFNHDGNQDVASGPYWWEGPVFATRHTYYPDHRGWQQKQKDGSTQTVQGYEGALGTKNTYSDNFFAFSHDFNGNGWDDILILGFPGAESSRYENPQGKDGYWARHVILDVTDNEFHLHRSDRGRKTGNRLQLGRLLWLCLPNWDHPKSRGPFTP